MNFDLPPASFDVCLSVPRGRTVQRTFGARIVEAGSGVFLLASALVLTVAMFWA